MFLLFVCALPEYLDFLDSSCDDDDDDRGVMAVTMTVTVTMYEWVMTVGGDSLG